MELKEFENSVHNKISESVNLLDMIWENRNIDIEHKKRFLRDIKEKIGGILTNAIDRELSQNQAKESAMIVPETIAPSAFKQNEKRKTQSQEHKGKKKKKSCQRRFTKKDPSFFQNFLTHSNSLKCCLKFQTGKPTIKWNEVHEVALAGHTTLLDHLLDLGKDVNKRDPYLKTPLMLAAQIGDMGMAQSLLRAKAKVNEKIPFSSPTNPGETALSLAYKNDNIDIVGVLVESGAKSDIKKHNHPQAHRQTAVLEAYMNGANMSTPGFKFLMEANDSPDMKNMDGSTLLVMAAEKGDVAVVEFLIASGADLNLCKSSKREKNMMKRARTNLAPLAFAAMNGHLGVVNALIQGGATADIWAFQVGTPLMLAAKAGHFKIILLLLEAGASTDFGQQGNIFSSAIESDREDVVQFLIDQGHLEEQKNKARNERFSTVSPLMLASSQGKVALVQILLDAGFPLEFRCQRTGHDALSIAVCTQRNEVVSLLINAGATINGVNIRDGRTLLMAACSTSTNKHLHLCLTTLLGSELYNKENINEQASNGDTALMIASVKGDVKSVRILIKAGADPNLQNQAGETALILMSKEFAEKDLNYLPLKKIQGLYKNYTQIVSIFSNSEMDVDIQDRGGMTALMYAVKANRQKKCDIQGELSFIKALLECKPNFELQNRSGKTALSFKLQPHIRAVLKTKAR